MLVHSKTIKEKNIYLPVAIDRSDNIVLTISLNKNSVQSGIIADAV